MIAKISVLLEITIERRADTCGWREGRTRTAMGRTFAQLPCTSRTVSSMDSVSVVTISAMISSTRYLRRLRRARRGVRVKEPNRTAVREEEYFTGYRAAVHVWQSLTVIKP